MIKKVLMGVGALVVLPALFFGRDASSYFHTAKNNMRDAVKQEIPAEFEVERVRDMVENLVPDIRQCMHVIAEQQVDMEHLQSDIVRREDTIADQEKILLSMTKDLDGGHQEIQYASRTYTSDEVKRDLAVRFDKFKVAKEALQRDRKILKAREKALVANQQKLDNMLSAKQDLEVQIAQLDARLN
jgi:peptidoglycan hydrolase CwlO-like protein